MRDVRLLFLYKQHYLDSYGSGLNFDISCFGYYDELKVQETENEFVETLTKKKSESPLYQIWYYTGNSMNQLKGHFSIQTIGMFREQQERDKKFWDLDGKMPYFFVGFVKVNGDDYKGIRERLESEFAFDRRDEDGVICNVIVYYTFDNADLIILMHSNSLKHMTETAEQISGLAAIKYMHSIVGIREKYLKECEDEGRILETWNGFSCFTREPVAKLAFKVATDGNKACEGKLKKEIEKQGGGSVSASYSYGHGNVYMEAQGEQMNVGGIINMMKPGGILTHKNGVYGRGLYNIETSLYMVMRNDTDDKCQEWKKAGKEGNELSGEDSWCSRILRMFNNDIYSELREKEEDKGILSILQAFMKTLNILGQCERFEMSNDIWALIAPNVRMFADKLQVILKKQRLLSDKSEMQMIKEKMELYIESVNSIIYHMIHTDQIYLMIPGYSGTSFSIPAKLSLFYMWYMEKLKQVLNDTNDEYSFILNPIMESKPSTMEIDLDISDKKRLICLKVAQRHLHMPRHLMVILGHEAGHYIGKNGRRRKSRMEYIIRTLAYVLTEGIFPENYEGDAVGEKQRRLFFAFKKLKKELIHKRILDAFEAGVRVEFEDRDYHSKKLYTGLHRLCMNTMLGIEYGVDFSNLLFSIPDEIYQMMTENGNGVDPEDIEDMKYIASVQETLEGNRMKLVVSGGIEWVIKKLIDIYLEIYADAVTFAVLGCDYEDYEASFSVSEGFAVTDNRLYNFRKAIAKVVLSGKGNAGMKNDYDGSVSLEKVDNVTFLRNRLFNFRWVREMALRYGNECYQYLENSIKEQLEEVGEIRKVYKAFTNQEKNCEEIYDLMSRCSREYKSNFISDKDTIK